MPRAAIVIAAIVALAAACSSSQSDSSAPILTTVTSTTAPDEAITSTSTTAPPDTSTTLPLTTTTADLDELTLGYVEVGSGFDAPVLLVADPDGGPDLVVEQPGRIVTVPDRRVVLDITGDVLYSGEQGLLGLAFHPDFARNRLAYIDYVANGRVTVIEQFTVRPDGVFDLGSRVRILSIDQPAGNHNGGMVAFGPDGYLWVGMGDGGGSYDRYGNGQRADTLLGAMLRIAVGVPGVERYAIPPDNPYADGASGAPEVWWIGLRNPWRFSFDGGEVYVADVGQGAVEEVDLAPADEPALNFGWPNMEGSSCLEEPCGGDFVLPIVEYGHDEGCSITGGYVYRGVAIPELVGQYFYSDYCSGFLRSWSAASGGRDWTDDVGRTASVTGFGVGGDGELYVVSQDGTVRRLERAG